MALVGSATSSKDGSSRHSSIGSALKKTAQTAAETFTGKAKKKKNRTKRAEIVATMPPSTSATQHSQVHEDQDVKPPAVTLDDIPEGTHANKDVTVSDGSPSADGSNLSKESSTQGDAQGGTSWLSVESQLRNKLKSTAANLQQVHDACNKEDWHGYVGDENNKVDAALDVAEDRDLHPNPFNKHKLEGRPKDEPWQAPQEVHNSDRPELLKYIRELLVYILKTPVEDISLIDAAYLYGGGVDMQWDTL